MGLSANPQDIGDSMKSKFLGLLLLLCASNSTYGHHELEEDANFGHLIQFGGTITAVEWAEPHVLVRVVGNPNLANSPQWLVALASPNRLNSEGIDLEDFEILSHASFIGYPSKGSYRTEDSILYGLYLARSPSDRVLMNPDLLMALENASGLKAISTNEGGVFTVDP